MTKRRSFHVPVFIWVFLTCVFFYNFTDDKANKTVAGKQHTRFEKYIDSIYRTCDLKKAGMGRGIFEKAMVGYYNVKGSDSLCIKKPIISVIDFTKKSTEKRLWIVDLAHGKLLYHTLVAHGRNTGEQYATCFSNKCSSNMSSLGMYVTGETYTGKHGLSLALDGLEPGFNDNARERAVVMHAADYVSEDFINNVGRLGRSQGCPALPAELAPEIINTVADGSCLFMYYPDKIYMEKSLYANAATATAAFEKENRKWLVVK